MSKFTTRPYYLHVYKQTYINTDKLMFKKPSNLKISVIACVLSKHKCIL